MRDFPNPYYDGPCSKSCCEALREEGRKEMKSTVYKYMEYGMEYVYYILTGGKDIYENDPRKQH